MFHRQDSSVRWDLFIPILILTVIGAFILRSLNYLDYGYIVIILVGFCLFFFFSRVEFEILSIISKYLYGLCILLLLATIIIGQATRGTIRWIPVGTFTIQPAEIVRPFLLIFWATYLNGVKRDFNSFIKGFVLFLIPTFLIFIQPSLGVTLLTSAGFLGVLLASTFPRKYYLIWFGVLLISLPLAWASLADYQQARVLTFLEPSSDPKGAGYNSVQSMISVGSGKILGRGLGRGVQTQLAFLPERQTDFIFASIAEEMGFLGVIVVLSITFVLLFRLIKSIEKTSGASRSYLTGLFLSLFAQIMVHVCMNLSLIPITGVTYPLLSAGGSSLFATMISFGIASSANRGTS